MNTSEIINSICSQMGIAKAELAKRMGLHPSSLYRKLSRETMTFKELQKCLDALGVTIELQFQCPDGHRISSQENHEQLVERMGVLEKKLEAASKVDEFRKKSLKDLRTELNSARNRIFFFVPTTDMGAEVGNAFSNRSQPASGSGSE